MFHIMHTSEDLDQAIAASEEKPVVFFKHSATCPFSAAAQLEVAHAEHDHDLNVYGIVVQYAPDLKAEMADRLSVEHQSPQAIVVYKGEATASYWRSEIKRMQLTKDVKANS